MSEFQKYETPTSKRVWIFILALFAAWLFTVYSFAVEAAEVPPAAGPDYVTSFGIRVYDPFHHSFQEEIDLWTFMTLVKAPEEDRGYMLDIFDGATLVIHKTDQITDEVYPCGKSPEGKILLGCTDPFSKTINIAWRDCSRAPSSSAGIFAHEWGHLADFLIRGVLGHTNPLWFGPDQDRMARLVAGPICRMSK